MPENPYAPTEFDPHVMERFEGINTLTTRAGVPDEQMAWCDGFMPIAPRNLRTLYGLAAPIWTVLTPGATIVKLYMSAISLAFLSDGSVWQIELATGANNRIILPGNIANPSPGNIGVVGIPSVGIAIVCNQPNGFFFFNGTTVFFPSGVVPGVGTVPVGINGTTAEMYAGRLWIGNGRTVFYSSPFSILDFSAAAGGGSFSSSDAFLRVQFVRLLQTNGFLYLIADGSINYISGVQTSGISLTTTFTNQNADPETGASWADAVTTWGHDILIPNPVGVHRLSGASVTKVSTPLDGIYGSVNPFAPAFTPVPSSAKATIFGKRVWMMLMPIIDPVSLTQVNKLLMWDGKNWWTSPQDVPLTYIAYYEQSSQLFAYGTDGTHLYLMFSQPSIAFTKIVRSKYWDRPGGYMFSRSEDRFWSLWNYTSVLSPNFTVGVDAVAVNRTTGATVENTSMYTITGPPGAGYFTSPPQAIGQQGVLTGMTIRTNAADASLVSAALSPNLQEYRG